MPPLEESSRHQAAVLWPALGHDEFGEVVVGEPVELFPPEGTGVDWWWVKRDRQDTDGQRVMIDAEAIVDRLIAVGSELWLAPDPTLRPLDQWYGPGGTAGGSSGEGVGICTVIESRRTPDMKGRVYLHEVRMARKHFSEAERA